MSALFLVQVGDLPFFPDNGIDRTGLETGAALDALLFHHLPQEKFLAAVGWTALVIDVRTEAEFREQHLPGALNIPLDRLSEEIARHAPDKSKPLLLHCRSGARSEASVDSEASGLPACS